MENTSEMNISRKKKKIWRDKNILKKSSEGELEVYSEGFCASEGSELSNLQKCEKIMVCRGGFGLASC